MKKKVASTEPAPAPEPETKISFDDLKKELLEKAKVQRACADQFLRAAKSKTEDELLKVVNDNLDWCVGRKIITNEWLSKFNPEILLNSGIANTGLENSGFANSGSWNSGDSNSGYRNSGSWNSGDRNSGDSNSGYRNSGAFCTDKNPMLLLFNKPTNIPVKDWERHKAVELMSSIDPTIWVPGNAMTDEEKEDHPKWETTEGYLKTISMKEAWANFWHNLSDSNKKVFTTLPNFDSAIFEEITGIKV